MTNIVECLDRVASMLEDKGFIKEAFGVDVVSNTIEKIASSPGNQALRKKFSLCDGDLDKAYLKKIKQVATEKGLKHRSLGDVGDTELLLIEPAKKNKGKSILVVSGLHGDEQAGPFGVLRYLERVGENTLDSVNISLIPLLNPTGFRKRTRDNQWGEQTNRGYCKSKKISREGVLLKDSVDLLKNAAKDGLITLHEDPEAKSCYIYMYKGKKSEELGDILIGVDRMFFDQRRLSKEPGGEKIVNGIAWDCEDNSFEDWMNEQGVPIVATTETPGAVDFEERVQANTMLLSAFVDFFLK